MLLLGLRLFFSNLNPLWGLWERWPRILDKQNLHGKFDGLIRFGVPGARCSFTEVDTDSSFSFIKESPAGQTGVLLDVRANSLPVDLASLLERQSALALPAGACVAQGSAPGEFHLHGAESAELVAIAHKVAVALGHSSSSKYRCHTTGPNDAKAISEFLER